MIIAPVLGLLPVFSFKLKPVRMGIKFTAIGNLLFHSILGGSGGKKTSAGFSFELGDIDSLLLVHNKLRADYAGRLFCENLLFCNHRLHKGFHLLGSRRGISIRERHIYLSVAKPGKHQPQMSRYLHE
jgi:hypothetical protein